MAGASFGTGFNALAAAPKPARPGIPKSKGASLSGLHNPAQTPGAGLIGLSAPKQTAPAPTPPKVSGTTTAPAQSPLDSTYYTQIAGDQLRLGNSLNSLGAESQNNTTALQAALQQLAYQQPRDELTTMQNANNRGALYSSAYGQDLGKVNNAYQTKQGNDITSNAQKQAGIAAQISALQQGEPITEAGLYDAAVARAAKNAAANPATGQASIPPPIPAATVAARSAVSKGQASSASALAKAIAGQKKGTAALINLRAARR